MVDLQKIKKMCDVRFNRHGPLRSKECLQTELGHPDYIVEEMEAGFEVSFKISLMVSNHYTDFDINKVREILDRARESIALPTTIEAAWDYQPVVLIPEECAELSKELYEKLAFCKARLREQEAKAPT